MRFITAAVLCLMVVSCKTDYTEWRGGGVQRGSGGACKVVEGVEVWTYGSPNKPYRIIGVIEDSRPGAILPMARRDSNVASEAKERGGDGVIMIGSQKEQTGTFNTMNAQTYTTGTLTGGTTYLGPGLTRYNGQYQGTSNTFGAGVGMNVYRASAQYQVFKYE